MKRVKLDISYIICNSSIKSICFKNFSILFFRFLVFTRLNYLWSFAIALLETMAKAFGNCIGYRIDFATICTKLERSLSNVELEIMVAGVPCQVKVHLMRNNWISSNRKTVSSASAKLFLQFAASFDQSFLKLSLNQFKPKNYFHRFKLK